MVDKSIGIVCCMYLPGCLCSIEFVTQNVFRVTKLHLERENHEGNTNKNLDCYLRHRFTQDAGPPIFGSQE
jgi:hypothetical protein